jgi:hypothetical protein
MRVIVVATLPDGIGDRNAFSAQVHCKARALDLAHDMNGMPTTRRKRRCDVRLENALGSSFNCGNFRISIDEILAHEPLDELFRILERRQLPLPAVENELTLGALRQRHAQIVQQPARRKLLHERSGLESNGEPLAIGRAS